MNQHDAFHGLLEKRLAVLSGTLLGLTERPRWDPRTKDDIRAYAREVELYARLSALNEDEAVPA